MKKTILLCSIVVLFNSLFGQNEIEPRLNAIFYELKYIHATLTINYERKFIKEGKHNIGLRTGFGFFHGETYGYYIFQCPLTMSYLYAITPKNFIEIGGGILFTNNDEIYKNTPEIRVMYRIVGENGLILSIGFVPKIINNTNNYMIYTRVGLNVGCAF